MTKYEDEYIKYLIYFHTDRDYFECHEVLEEYWKANPLSELKKAWSGLIQVAVSTYHHRRNNLIGAQKMLDQALLNLTRDDLIKLGVDAEKFVALLQERKQLIEQQPEHPYRDLNIPLNDQDLLKLCIELGSEHGKQWGSPSDMSDELLIHKHSLRDRSKVIQARLKELQRRRLS